MMTPEEPLAEQAEIEAEIADVAADELQRAIMRMLVQMHDNDPKAFEDLRKLRHLNSRRRRRSSNAVARWLGASGGTRARQPRQQRVSASNKASFGPHHCVHSRETMQAVIHRPQRRTRAEKEKK